MGVPRLSARLAEIAAENAAARARLEAEAAEAEAAAETPARPRQRGSSGIFAGRGWSER